MVELKTLPEIEATIRTTPEPSNSQLNTWFKHLLKNDQIFVLQAQNEQDPIPEDLLGYPIRAMPLKADNGRRQVADYQFKVKNTWGSFIVERKSMADLYGTLFSRNYTTKEKQRDRLYREISRFNEDDRFDKFIIMVEGSLEEFLKYIPLKERHTESEYWVKVSKMLNAKKATLNSLQVRPGVQLIFCGSRSDMIEQYRDMIRQWTLQNWKEILGCAEVEQVCDAGRLGFV